MSVDSSLIDAALVSLLLNDGTLAALMPDGVWFDVAAQDAQRFVIVSLVEEHDDEVFNARAFENPLYAVKAVALSTSGGDVKTAAARIDALLEQGSLGTVAGYSITGLFREARIRYSEVDGVDPSIRWQHRGGHYRVVAGLT